jgi:hypothetical protein
MRPLPIILSFFAGAIVASAVWSVFLFRCQMEMTTQYLLLSYREAEFNERTLSYIDRPDPAMEHLLIFSASNHIAHFQNEVDYWDKRYPYIHIEQDCALMTEHLQTFLRTNSVLHKTQPNTALEPTPTAP